MAILFPSVTTAHHHVGGHYREIDTLERLAGSLSDAYSLFHNIDWSMSGDRLDAHGEIDIIVMNQAGDLLLMEIKAGSVELRSTGIYKQYSHGERQVDRQVKFQFSSLKARLQQANLTVTLKNCLVLPDYRIGEQEIVGMPRDRIVDATRFDQLGSFVQSVLSAGISNGCADKVRAFLLNELDVVKDFSALNEQVRVGNTRISGGLASWVPRIKVPSGTVVVSATAGSGKTLLAIQLLENAIKNGQKALYVCFNRSLADSMLKVAPVQSTVATFHELSIQHFERSTGDIDFSGEGVFKQAEAHYIGFLNDANPWLDVLIIDEAQDFELEWVEALTAALTSAGMLYMLQDQNQRLYDRPVFDCTDAVVVESNENFRSPRAVVQAINLFGLTSEKIRARSIFVGDSPEIVRYGDTEEALIACTSAAITHYLEKGFKPAEIVVLTMRGIKHSALARPKMGPHSISYFNGQFDKSKNPVWTDGDILFDSVYRFKGQSASAVILSEIDFDVLDDLERKKLFVGMTRAEIDLTLVISSRAEKVLGARMGVG
ncbi:MAG: AAA family ATPase [Paralcaligenes sp.]